MSQVTSEEVNYLIYRYLQEAGFVHSSFTFGQESFISRSDIKPEAVPPGMLISIIQRGLQYAAIEFHLNEDGSEKECGRPWSLLAPHVCEKPKPSKPTRTPSASASGIINIEDAMPMGQFFEGATKPGTSGGGKKRKNKEPGAPNGAKQQKTNKGAAAAAAAAAANVVERFLESEVVTLTGHQSEVISCAWNPNPESGLLASVAGDDTGRVWHLVPGQKLEPEHLVGHELILAHQHEEGQSKEVTSLDWSPDGRFLVTGCYDGKASLWLASGELKATLNNFRGPVFALKWSPSGKLIAGAGLEHCAVVWDAASPEALPLKVFQNHGSPTMDLDWRDDTCFATCTTEKSIYIYSLDQEEPLKTYFGHEDEINSVKWSPDGSRLASCSDDGTARIWSPFTDEEKLPLILKGHEKEIYCLKWSPTGPGSANPGLPPVLATASFDQTIRLWNPLNGECLHVLRRHTDSVYAIGFSPDGKFLASGSLDESLNIWSVAQGSLVRTYDSGRGGIFELAWNPTGDRLAACTSDSTVCVFEFRP